MLDTAFDPSQNNLTIDYIPARVTYKLWQTVAIKLHTALEKLQGRFTRVHLLSSLAVSQRDQGGSCCGKHPAGQ